MKYIYYKPLKAKSFGHWCNHIDPLELFRRANDLKRNDLLLDGYVEAKIDFSFVGGNKEIELAKGIIEELKRYAMNGRSYEYTVGYDPQSCGYEWEPKCIDADIIEWCHEKNELVNRAGGTLSIRDTYSGHVADEAGKMWKEYDKYVDCNVRTDSLVSVELGSHRIIQPKFVFPFESITQQITEAVSRIESRKLFKFSHSYFRVVDNITPEKFKVSKITWPMEE